MSYFHIDSHVILKNFVAVNGEWLAMKWSGDYDYYTVPVAMWAICEDENGSARILGIVGDGDIGGEFNCVGGDDDQYFIGYIEPGSDAPDADEIKIRVDIIKELMKENQLDAERNHDEN